MEIERHEARARKLDEKIYKVRERLERLRKLERAYRRQKVTHEQAVAMAREREWAKMKIAELAASGLRPAAIADELSNGERRYVITPKAVQMALRRMKGKG
jgi:hypothetical protein